MQIKKEIRHTVDRLERLVEKLTSVSAMVRGSFCVVHCRCGKPTCWCARSDEKGHVSMRITWNEKRKPRIKTVSSAEEPWARSTVGSYREFREWRRELRGEEERLEKLLDELEDDIVKNTRKKYGF